MVGALVATFRTTGVFLGTLLIASCASDYKPIDPLAGLNITSGQGGSLENLSSIRGKPVAIVLSQNVKLIIDGMKTVQSNMRKESEKGGGFGRLDSQTYDAIADANDPKLFVSSAALIVKKHFPDGKLFDDAEAAFKSDFPVVVIFDIHDERAGFTSIRYRATFIFIKANPSRDLLRKVSGAAEGDLFPQNPLALTPPAESMVTMQTVLIKLRKQALANLDRNLMIELN